MFRAAHADRRLIYRELFVNSSGSKVLRAGLFLWRLPLSNMGVRNGTRLRWVSLFTPPSRCPSNLCACYYTRPQDPDS